MFHILLFHQEFKRVCHHLTKEQVADALNKNNLKHKLIGIKWNQWISKIGCFASEYLNRLSTCLYAFPVVNWKFFHAFPDPVNPIAYYSVKTFQIVHWHAPSPQIQEWFSQADEEKNVIKSAFIGSVPGWCCFQGIWRLWGLAGMRSKLLFFYSIWFEWFIHRASVWSTFLQLNYNEFCNLMNSRSRKKKEEEKKEEEEKSMEEEATSWTKRVFLILVFQMFCDTSFHICTYLQTDCAFRKNDQL